MAQEISREELVKAYSTNPLIGADPESTLNAVATSLTYIQESLFDEKAGARKELDSDMVEGLYHLNRCIIYAVRYEEEQAIKESSIGGVAVQAVNHE